MINIYKHITASVLFAFAVFSNIDAQVASDWDLSSILSVMDKSWSVGNGCFEANNKTISVYNSLELNGHTLEIMDATVQVFGGLTNFGLPIDESNELILYSCTSSELIVYRETLTIKDDVVVFDFKLYPNPARDLINVVVNNLDTYSVYDIKGNLLLRGSSKRIYVDKLSAGVYFLYVEYNGLKKVKRFIKK